MPGPKQGHRRACREISANGRFEEEYLEVHGASAWQLCLLFYWSSKRYDQYEASRLNFCQSVLLKILHNLWFGLLCPVALIVFCIGVSWIHIQTVSSCLIPP